MPDLPMNPGPMAQGLGYYSMPAPTTDAASTASAPSESKCMDSTNPVMYLTPVSLATEMDMAPEQGNRLTSDLHEDGWLNQTQPHVGNPNR